MPFTPLCSLDTGFRSTTLAPQAAPFPTEDNLSTFRGAVGQGLTRLKYRYGNEVLMDGFSVSSNSTKFLHSEQMVDLGGPIALLQAADGSYQVTNKTNYTLRGAGVIWNRGEGIEGIRDWGLGMRGSDSDVPGLWRDLLIPNPQSLIPLPRPPSRPLRSKRPGSASLSRGPRFPFDSKHFKGKASELWKHHRDDSPITAEPGERTQSEELSLRRLLDLAQKDPDPAGEMRLVACGSMERFPARRSSRRPRSTARQRRSSRTCGTDLVPSRGPTRIRMTWLIPTNPA